MHGNDKQKFKGHSNKNSEKS